MYNNIVSDRVHVNFNLIVYGTAFILEEAERRYVHILHLSWSHPSAFAEFGYHDHTQRNTK